MNADSPSESAEFRLAGARVPADPLPPGLYVVATPIGHLDDITLRALKTLAAADLIACEDSRVTQRLTRHYGIRAPLVPYHEHNAARQRPKLLAALAEGKAVALVSDAGTPLVSDPGYRLVLEAVEAGAAVIPIPGPSAVLAALAAAGLPTDAFLFAGFLPPKSAARRRRLEELKGVPATLVFFESPRRAAEALADMAAVLGEARPAVLAREITKMFETFRRAPLGALAAALGAEPAPKGEIVILVGPPDGAGEPVDEAALDALLAELAADMPPGRAAAEAARRTGLPRPMLYERLRALKGDDGAAG